MGHLQMMVGGGPDIPLVEVPALADITRRLLAMPPYMFDGRPFAVEPQLWHQASDEMRQVMDARGWPVLAADIDRTNFMFRGVAIVMGE